MQSPSLGFVGIGVIGTLTLPQIGEHPVATKFSVFHWLMLIQCTLLCVCKNDATISFFQIWSLLRHFNETHGVTCWAVTVISGRFVKQQQWEH